MSDRRWTRRQCGDAPRRKKGAAGGAACLALLLCGPALVGAEEGQDDTLKQLTIEQLAHIDVTTVTKHA